MIVLIRKKEEGEKVENYKGVTLMPLSYKMNVTIVADRVKREVEKKEIKCCRIKRDLGKEWGRWIIYMF